MKVVWKFHLTGGRCSIEMPKGAIVLSVQVQYGKPMLWAEVDPSAEVVKRRFRLLPTGLNFDGPETVYVGTLHTHHGEFVYHVYMDDREYPLTEE